MGTRERKEREREARKNAILEAAKTVFFQKGLHAATMNQIAEAAELSKGTLYLYFSNKEELYVSILLEGLELLHERFEKAVKDTEGWEGKLRNIAWAYYSFYQEQRSYFDILFLYQHGEIMSNISEPLYQMCFEKGLSCLNVLSRAIKEGMDAGEIESHDPIELAIILWGSFNGIFLLHEEVEHRKFIGSTLEDLLQMSANLLLDGLKKR